MAEPKSIEREEVTPSDLKKDTRKPHEGEELSQAEQDQVSGGIRVVD